MVVEGRAGGGWRVPKQVLVCARRRDAAVDEGVPGDRLLALRCWWLVASVARHVLGAFIDDQPAGAEARPGTSAGRAAAGEVWDAVQDSI